MEIRGLTLEQIQQAIQEVNHLYYGYNGNITLGNALGYGYVDAESLNNRGDAFKVGLGVESSRRPGARVSPEMYFYGSDTRKPRRVASPCWHANRDFIRAIFEINPDARIRTALTNTDDFAAWSEYLGYGRKRQYTGSEHFEDLYQYTDKNIGNSFSHVAHSEACNCDEGYYPEFATEGLTEDQYSERYDTWRYYPEESYVKAPKREKAVTVKEVSPHEQYDDTHDLRDRYFATREEAEEHLRYTLERGGIA
jgi:hypothetical protein